MKMTIANTEEGAGLELSGSRHIRNNVQRPSAETNAVYVITSYIFNIHVYMKPSTPLLSSKLSPDFAFPD
jgi:hypothetical protein